MTALGKLWTDAVAYVALILGAGLSIAGNVADTYRTRAASTDPLDIVMAVAWPALVVLMVEIFVSTRWTGLSWPMQLLRWLGTLAIGGMAMRVSWVHLNDLMASRGQKADVAILGPLAIDCLAIMATALILAGRRGQRLGHDSGQWVNPVQVATKLANGQDDGQPGLGQALANSEDTAIGPWPPLATREDFVAKAAEAGQDVGQSLANAYATIGDEASNWLASLANHPDLDNVTSTPPAPLPQRPTQPATDARRRVNAERRAAKYDKAAARIAIRGALDAGTDGAEIDAVISEAFGISTRTARRLRAEVTGQPVSGPPDDEGVV